MKLFLALSFAFAMNLGAQECPESSQLDQNKISAEQAYASQNWSVANTQFQALCPCLSSQEQVACKIWAIRSLVAQIDPAKPDSNKIAQARSHLDTLLIRTEPERPDFADIMLLQSSLQLLDQQPLDAWKSWRLAKQVALTGGQESLLKTLCQKIEVQINDTTLTGKECGKIPPLGKRLQKTLQQPTPLATKSSAGTWILQFGAFSNRDNAQLMLDNLTKRKIPTRIVQKNIEDRTLYLVQTQPFANRDAAEEYGRKTLAPMKLEFQPLLAP